MLYPAPFGFADGEPMELSLLDDSHDGPWHEVTTSGTSDAELCKDLDLLAQAL